MKMEHEMNRNTYTIYDNDNGLYAKGLTIIEVMHYLLSYDIHNYSYEVRGDSQHGWTLWAKCQYSCNLCEIDTAFAETENEAMDKIAKEIINRHKLGLSKLIVFTDDEFEKWNDEWSVNNGSF